MSVCVVERSMCPSGGAFATASPAIWLARAWPVLDDHALTQRFTQTGRNRPRDDVGRTARREPDEHTHWLHRVLGLCERHTRACRERKPCDPADAYHQYPLRPSLFDQC